MEKFLSDLAENEQKFQIYLEDWKGRRDRLNQGTYLNATVLFHNDQYLSNILNLISKFHLF